jgi:hypothetical protein
VKNLQGSISSISVAGMLRLLCSYGKTGRLNVNSGKTEGSIMISEGSIIGADIKRSYSNVSGIRQSVVQLLLATDDGSFYFDENSVKHGTAQDICVEDVILESARLIAEKYMGIISVKDLIPPENEVLRTSKFTLGKTVTITFTSDEWNLLGSFNGDTNITSAIEESGIEKAKAEVVMYGLVSAGLVRRLRFKIPELTKIAKEAFGNIGIAVVDNEMTKQKIDRRKMGMKNFIGLLNGLEISFAEIVGKSKAREVIEKIWNATK